MSIRVYSNNAWRNVGGLSAFHAGAWREIKRGWVFRDNAWRVIYLYPTRFNFANGTTKFSNDTEITQSSWYTTPSIKLKSVTIGLGVTSIADFAFNRISETWNSLSSVTFVSPSRVTSFGREPFINSLISNIQLPDSLISIGYAAFNNCTSLTGVVIPNNVKYIDQAAFGNCTNMISVTIGNSVTGIGAYAFAPSKISNVTIPASVTHLYGPGAFSNCAQLTGVYFKGNAPVLTSQRQFDNTNANCKVYYCQGTTGWYTPWPGAIIYGGRPAQQIVCSA